MKDYKIYIYLPLVLALAIAAGIFIGSRYNVSSVNSKVFGLGFSKFNKLNDILNYVLEEYVDSVDRDELIDGSLSAVLKELDPHSAYIPPRNLSAINEPLEGNFEGIGIEFRIISDTVVVLNAMEGGPSRALGIEAGDRIIKIDGHSVAGVGIVNKEVVNVLRGGRGTRVDISIHRRGTTSLIDYEITRGSIPIRSVVIAYMITPNIGYIKINRFSAKTYEEYLTAFKSLPASKLEGMIIDLRSNPGGYLSASTSLADEFLPDRRLIVYTEGKSQPKHPYFATEIGGFEEGRLVVLIDRNSASASEIVAGALQDNDRGTIIGRRSFGKGLVQRQYPFPDGSAIRLTIARYYTPTGRCIQRPYDQGLAEYYYQMYQRDNEESGVVDSSLFADSLRYTTPLGKVVYGGGGIMPDIVVEVDTLGASAYLDALMNHRLLSRFAFDYTDRHRHDLLSYEDYRILDRHLMDSEDVMKEFIAFADANDVAFDQAGFETSRQRIEMWLKAYVADNLWSNKGMLPILHKYDHDVRKAIEVLNEQGASTIAEITE
ncbi:MAG: S41 family peptidase [Flavobacteriales bacterium]|nr:S41 family peptidase [Flavobacteriales bacterium]